MKTFLVTLFIFFIHFQTIGQEKIGKIDLQMAFQKDPDSISKNERIKRHVDSIFTIMSPEITELSERLEALDTNDKYYEYKVRDIQDKYSRYQKYFKEEQEKKMYKLYLTPDLQKSAYLNIFSKENLSCLLMYHGYEFLGAMYITDDFEKKLKEEINTNASTVITKLRDHFDKNESMDFYKVIDLNKEEESDKKELLLLYLKYYAETIATDYSYALLKNVYGE